MGSRPTVDADRYPGAADRAVFFNLHPPTMADLEESSRPRLPGKVAGGGHTDQGSVLGKSLEGAVTGSEGDCRIIPAKGGAGDADRPPHYDAFGAGQSRLLCARRRLAGAGLT